MRSSFSPSAKQERLPKLNRFSFENQANLIRSISQERGKSGVVSKFAYQCWREPLLVRFAHCSALD
jgi:hypothetical protein